MESLAEVIRTRGRGSTGAGQQTAARLDASRDGHDGLSALHATRGDMPRFRARGSAHGQHSDYNNIGPTSDSTCTTSPTLYTPTTPTRKQPVERAKFSTVSRRDARS